MQKYHPKYKVSNGTIERENMCSLRYKYLIKFVTNQQQHGVEIVYQKKGVSNDQTYVSNNSNHKASTTWEFGSKY